MGKVDQYECSNPSTLISNHGHMEVSNITINMNVTESSDSNNATRNWKCFRFEDDGEHGFISNYGIMTITDMVMERSLSRYMLYNEGTWLHHVLTSRGDIFQSQCDFLVSDRHYDDKKGIL